MSRSQAAAPPLPSPGVGWMMARLDRPYPGTAVHVVGATVLLVAVVLIGAFALVQHQAADVAFRGYVLKTATVDISGLATHPERYLGQLVHTQGRTGDVVLTDAGNQVVLSLPQASEGTGSDGPEILVLTEADVPPHRLVDVWGTFVGTLSLSGRGTYGPMPLVRAEYVRPAQ